MEQTRITITEYCSYHDQVEPQFVLTLLQSGLIGDPSSDAAAIPYDQLQSLERYIRLHYDLDINVEGLEAIHHMLARMERMQEEMQRLRNRVAFLEKEG